MHFSVCKNTLNNVTKQYKFMKNHRKKPISLKKQAFRVRKTFF